MAELKDELFSPNMLKARNEILVKIGDYTFEKALEEVKSLLKNEKNTSTRLALLAAKSWIIRNKVYAMVHEPFVYSLDELENTNIFSNEDDGDADGGLDGLFDDDDSDNDGDGDGDGDEVEVSIIKSTTLNGVKLKKDMIIKASQDDAEKLVSENKAKYLD
tara:strand:- start:170 stop:652 length:483 start_codon:yes stop_codon:yes gene_type:complete